eukprot:gene20509-22527_t
MRSSVEGNVKCFSTTGLLFVLPLTKTSTTTSNLSLFRSMLNFVVALHVATLVNCQLLNNQWQSPPNPGDDFRRELCRERWHRLDWQQILQPCIGQTDFGRNTLPSTLRTNAALSRMLSMDIRSAAEYSKITIQSVDVSGRIKTLGGDSWRILITGPSSLQPVVYDMNNGLYEIPFLLMEPGIYKADIYLEGTLCNQLYDPPKDWFRKGDYNGHFQEANLYSNNPGWPKELEERTWDRLGGNASLIQFQINPTDHFRLANNMAKLEQATQLCNIPTSCDFVWDGFGRWIGQEWHPYSSQDQKQMQLERGELQTAERKKRGILWFYGDCFAFHFYEMEHNQTLCKEVFKSCGKSYNWVYPRLHSVPERDPTIHKKDSSDISVPKILQVLRKVLRKSKVNSADSALVLNYGLHMARSASFDAYRKLILGVINEMQDFKGQFIWRSTTAVWKQHWKVHKRFQTNQRVLLFNAFAASSFCNAGYPVLDVYHMTASSSHQPADGGDNHDLSHYPFEELAAAPTGAQLSLPNVFSTMLAMQYLFCLAEEYDAAVKKFFMNRSLLTRPNVTGPPLVATVKLYLLKIEEIQEVQEKFFMNRSLLTRPNVTGPPLVATVKLYLLKIEEIQEVQEIYTVDFYMKILWNDYRLRHNLTKQINLQANDCEKIWSPDIFFPNALKADAPKVSKPNQYARIKNNGDVEYSRRINVHAYCHLHLLPFPLDNQRCILHLESYAYPNDELILEWEVQKVLIEDKNMPGYEITSIHTEASHVLYLEGNYSRLSLITTYKRLLGFYMCQIYIPCGLIVMSSWLSLWLSIDEPGDRVALNITTNLAIVFLLQFVSASLPRVSYAKGIDYYIIGCFLQTFLCLVETVVATNYVRRQKKRIRCKQSKLVESKDSKTIHERIAAVTTQHQQNNVLDDELSLDPMAADDMATAKGDETKCNLETEAHDGGNQSDRINVVDRVSRVAFPLFFILFNLGYWLLFLYVIK